MIKVPQIFEAPMTTAIMKQSVTTMLNSSNLVKIGGDRTTAGLTNPDESRKDNDLLSVIESGRIIACSSPI